MLQIQNGNMICSLFKQLELAEFGILGCLCCCYVGLPIFVYSAFLIFCLFSISHVWILLFFLFSFLFLFGSLFTCYLMDVYIYSCMVLLDGMYVRVHDIGQIIDDEGVSFFFLLCAFTFTTIVGVIHIIETPRVAE